MEYDTIPSTFLSTAAILLIVAVTTAVFWQRRRLRGNLRLPPGPIGLPLVGSLLSLSPDLHVYFTKLAEAYGPIYRIRLGSKLSVVVSSPALAREVLRDNDLAMANHDVTAIVTVFTYGGNDMAFNPVGPTWRLLRRICVQEMLNPASLDAVYGLRRREMRATIHNLRASAGKEVQVGTQLFATVLNVIMSMLWGGTVEDEEERRRVGKEFMELVLEVEVLLGLPNLSDFFPALARFDLQGLQRKMQLLLERFDRIYDPIIEKKKKARNNQQEGGGGKDLLDYMLKLEAEKADSKTPFTLLNVKGILMNMVNGGTGTTASTTEWAMAELMQNAEIMERVQQELDQVVGKYNIVEETHIPKLHYLGAVIKEVLRLHHIAPLLVPRCASSSCTVGGYTIPQGSQVIVNAWAIQRNPSIWDDPLRFDPNRFLSTIKKWDAVGSDFTYIPFGAGRRICAGISMAERMTTYLLASLLHSFDWKLPEGTRLDLSEKFGLVVTMATPLVAIPTPRLPNPDQYSYV